MRRLDLTLPTPAENIACDEALLEAAETGASGEVLRLWESPAYFVVAGYANKLATEVDVAACEARGVPILRRCSGGGTVVQGPGCLSFALVLHTTHDGPTRNISSTNQFIMEQNRAAIHSAVGNPQSAIQIQGHTDLTIGGLKFSGNSQRRRKHFLLFHGTFLLNLNLEWVSEFLPLPGRQPDYRAGRPHAKFLTNLDLPATVVKRELAKAWEATDVIQEYPAGSVQELVARKYSTEEWNRKF